ncbi:transmembrane protein 59-like [Ixodes scapularis]
MFVKCTRNAFALLAISVALCCSEPVSPTPSAEADSCEGACNRTYPEHTYPDAKHLNACKKGCSLFTECGYNAVENDWNATLKACVNECSTAYPDSNIHYACNGGCQTQFDKACKDKDQKESDGSGLSLIMFVQRIYETVVYHFCRILRRTFLAVYLQKDTGNLVVVRGEMRPVAILDPHAECSTAYPDSNIHYACNGGCQTQFDKACKDKDQKESDGSGLSLIMFVQRIYETVVYHFCRILRRTFLAVYLQKDTGNLVVVRGEMRPVAILDPHAGDSEEEQSDPETSTAAVRTPEPTPVLSASGKDQVAAISPEEPTTMSSSWLDCISRQSGIPQWLLMLVLFLVVVTMVWLCCATMVRSPTPQQQPPPYSAQKMGVNGDLDYLLMYDPSEQIKIQPPQDQEAPPLPVKIPLNQI